MDKFDVVIVGAGPAGSAAAYYIDNLKVLIVDKFDFPRHKACGGGLMSSEDWPLELENYAKIKPNLKSYACQSIKLYWNGVYISGRKFKHLFDQIDRYELDNLLLKVALEKENIKFLKFELQDIRRVNLEGQEGYILSDNKTDIFASYIIGADGIYSRVAKYIGNKKRKMHEVGHCMEYDIVSEKKDECVHVLPGYKWEIGYAWLFPTPNGYQVGVGFTRKPRESLKYYLDEFLGWVVKKELIPKDYKIIKTFGGALPLKVSKKYCTDRILLCGDALGLVKQLSGEGIYYAMRSGKIAGQILSESRQELKERYQKRARPLIRDTRLTPYIPPKIFTLTFWTVFFYVGKLFDSLAKNLRVWNIFLYYFMKKVMHRRNFRKNSYYFNEKITPE